MKHPIPNHVYDYNPYSLPEDLLSAIGLMVACAGQTENVVEDAIAGCLGIDMEYGMALTPHMAMPLRYGILRSVAEVRIDDLDALDELDNLITAIKSAFGKRNLVVHNRWCIDPTNGDVFIITTEARDRFEVEMIPMSAEAIKRDAFTVYESGMNLFSFLRRQNLLPHFPTDVRPRGHKSKAARKKRRKGKA